MPLLAFLTPEPRSDRWWRKPDALRAFAYAVLALGDADVAAGAHALQGPRPFAAHLLHGAEGPVVRLAALDDPTAAAIECAVALVLSGRRLRLGGSPVGLADAHLEEPALYPTMAASVFRPVVRLEFTSPTMFSQGGDRHLPLPVPDLMLRSWARRWNASCPEGLTIGDDDIERLCASVGLAHAEVRTIMTQVARGKVVGFEGRVALEALRWREWHTGDRARFAALVAFSEYAGTGARTTQGMGLTLRRPDPPPRR